MGHWLLTMLTSVCAVGAGPADEPPVIPVGVDAYRQWDRWCVQRIGARAYMRSTYDRRGGNESADASHFLYQERDDFNVTLDVEGPGVLYFARYNHWHGSPWHYEVDGVDHIVEETSTTDPTKPVPDSVFIPEDVLPNPLTWTWSMTKGADLMWVPISFERSFRMAYSRTHYGTGYYIYHQYVPDAQLSQPIRAWDGRTPPDPAVLDLLNRAGSDIGPTDIETRRDRIVLAPQSNVELRIDADAPRLIRAVKFTIPQNVALDFGRSRLRITWDGREAPSVDAPLSLFFGAGVLYNRDGREYLVKALPVNIRYADGLVHLACYLPMPFFREARIELTDVDVPPDTELSYEVRYARLDAPPNHVGYFHATYRDHPRPELGRDLVLLDTAETEGGGDWSGQFIGTSFIFSHRAYLRTLEGDPRFFFDGSRTPQCYGTGTEEWGGGGDYWGGRNMTLPLAGHPCGARNPGEAKCDEDLIQSAYRFLLADLMPFGQRAVIRLEHGGENQTTEHYETVAYWYALPSPSLVKTDEIDVGDAASERSHDYHSPDASDVVRIRSRYEWGVDAAIPEYAPDVKARPTDYADFEFEADAGKTYFIWARGKPLYDRPNTDSFWIQFDDAIGTDGLGDTYATEFGVGNWLSGGEPQEYAWSSGRPQDPPLCITFATSGTHRARVQPRFGGHDIDQLWLSTTQMERPADNASAPRPERIQLGAIDQIVLGASNFRRVVNGINVVADKNASSGRTLRIEHKPCPIDVTMPQVETGRFTTGTSEFTVRLEPGNLGVLLRRTLDYAWPNQRAEVFVADTSGGRTPADGDWERAGVWYLAGSNTCVFSNPRGELGKTEHIVQTSNRRFRDDEFLIARRLTEGRSAIRVRVVFSPVERPLYPGYPVPDLAWSELRYSVYCYVMPRSPISD